MAKVREAGKSKHRSMADIHEAILEQVSGSADGVSIMEKKKGHALLLGLFFHAHFVGAYRLALMLAKEGVTITFLVPRKYISSLESSEELQGLDFNIVALPYDPDPPAFHSVFAACNFMKQAFEPYLKKLLADQKAGVSTPNCIISDRLLTWTGGSAKQLNVPYYMYFTNGSVDARFLHAFPHLVSQGAVKLEDNKVQEFEGVLNVSGLPPLRYQDIPDAIRNLPIVDEVLVMADFLQGADGVIMNTFYDLGARSIDALRTALRENSPRKDSRVEIFPIGPISTLQNFKDRSIIAGLENAGPECMLWLNEQPPSSVLFICLGTLARLDPPQIHELASALEASQQRFLWILPSGGENFSNLDDVLPPGYQTRLQGRGKVVNGWVPQLPLLNHSSIGGFLTHCGWNSIIESTLLGVPMLAWPQGGEQHLNCKFLVSEMKTAVAIGGDGAKQQNSDSTVVGAEEFERGINILMKGEEGRAMRKRAQELKVKAQAAVEPGGTSRKALEEFVDLISPRT